MEDFRKKLIRKYRLIIVFCCCCILPVYLGLTHLVKGADDFVAGLLSGMYSGIMIVSFFNLVRYIRLCITKKNLRRFMFGKLMKETLQSARKQ